MDSQTPVHRPWTLMIYMAGDNGKIFDTKTGRIKLMASMEEAGYRDIFELGLVGTTNQCAITCLFDTMDASYLVEVRKGKRLSDSLVQPLREVNMGDPNTLKEFIVHSVQTYPADHYALVIWNHGTGWLDVDAYATVRALEDEHRTNSAIFRTTYKQITASETTRPIAFDDSSKDFLDTADLRQAFSQAQDATGRRLDIIGMDACLMAMIEGARELAPFADYFVASQEVEPMAGWPYTPIVQALNAEPGLAPAALADRIVHEYAVSYHAATRAGEETVTQSAIALAATVKTEDLVKVLVEAILARQDDAGLKSLVKGCVKNTLTFQDKNYRDLGDFAVRLGQATEFEFFPEVTAAAKAVAEQLDARAVDAPVLRVAFRPRYAGATGLSVYVPSPLQPSLQREKALAVYGNLLFPQATGWDRLLAWVYSEF